MTTSVSEGILILLLTMLIALPFYGIARVCWLKRKARDIPGGLRNNPPWLRREIVLAVFTLFMLGLLTLTFQNQGLYQLGEGGGIVPRALSRLKTGIGTNFVPFRTIKRYIRRSLGWGLVMINIVGNIVMFLPWGLGLPLLWKRYQNALKMTLMSFALPFGIEFIQLFIGRSVDVDDVILNFTGGMLGWLLYLAVTRLFPKLKELAG